ncbi:peptide deformylase [Mangrovibacillus cuniculi]|uniref:Peptide deformylase n=1 Tax=Mangrovibacillus cuniculi TaxID=2593652 RepID=A0A7S8CA20_9BACI|nr:peptide deformylase [Mangrovibacillus cuniculi]QPC46187.1 peptide deformylase [Mangrovibacillus cuniculi]
MITSKDIIKEGSPVLREVAEDVLFPLSEEDRQLAEDLLLYLQMSQDPDLATKYQLRPGIGIAAPQVNVSKRMFAMRVTGEDGTFYEATYINPKIISHSVEKTYLATGEGCLSVEREVPGFVPRYAKVTMKAKTIQGEDVQLRLKGLPGICVQHEIDHLNGVMFYDHISPNDPFAPVPNATPLDRD